MAIVLRRGDKGKAVREVQGLLNSKSGKVVLTADGDFGGKTEAVVKDFQGKMKLKVDGMVGQKTWDALHNQALKAQFENSLAAHDWFSLVELEKFFTDLAKHSGGSLNSAPSSTPKTAHVASHAGASTLKPNTTTPPSQSNTASVVPAIVKTTDFKGFNRISFDRYEGRGYVIKDFKKFEFGAIQMLPVVKIIEPNGIIPETFKNECAQLVQYFGVPNTSRWLRGPRVCDFKPGELPEGTVVATLRDGKYYSDYSGRSHVGIYLTHDDYTSYLLSKNKSVGVTLMDQFNRNKISKRTKKYSAEADEIGKTAKKSWTDSKGVVRNTRVKWADDGEEYYVLLTKP